MSSKFQDAMRRVITGDNAQGQSILSSMAAPRPKRAVPIGAKCSRSARTRDAAAISDAFLIYNQIFKLACLAIPSAGVVGRPLTGNQGHL